MEIDEYKSVNMMHHYQMVQVYTVKV